jgi:hypothetical protein
MRKIFAFALPIICIAFVAGSAAHAKLPTPEERLDTGGVIKDITIPGESNMAHVTVRAVIDASPAVVWNTLKDIASWPRWLPMSKEAHLLSREAEPLITTDIAASQQKVVAIDKAHPNQEAGNPGSGTWQRLAYEEYDLPWPIDNEWVVRRYTYAEGMETKKASWRKIVSENAGNDGYWEVSPWKDGKTHLKYFYIVKVKGHAPEPLFKGAISLTVNSMIKALRKEVKKRNS